MENFKEMHSGYEWCLVYKTRLLTLSQWPTDEAFFAESYYNEKITYDDFKYRISLCTVKTNSIPRKTEMFLEYRMYGLVPYNLSPIQQGIQYGHAVTEYQQMVKSLPRDGAIFDKWAQKDKTSIILNGGTTNENPEREGTIQQHLRALKDNRIVVSEFREPDLNDTLTGICFLVDERVFNRELYPDFVIDNDASVEAITAQCEMWGEKIGGDRNIFLRTFLPKFRLA
jgi:hypothetical protein